MAFPARPASGALAGIRAAIPWAAGRERLVARPGEDEDRGRGIVPEPGEPVADPVPELAGQGVVGLRPVHGQPGDPAVDFVEDDVAHRLSIPRLVECRCWFRGVL